MLDVHLRSRFQTVEPLNKGWSNDKKYICDGTLLLRVCDASERDIRRAEFEHLRELEVLGVPTSRPIEFGICDGGASVFQLLTWLDGEDAEDVLPTLTGEEQYALGFASGEILRKIHSLPASPSAAPWCERFNKKVDRNIKLYRECGVTFDGAETILEYIEHNCALLQDRPQCFQHGDFHVGNMLINSRRELLIIDWNRCDEGDPWEEFNRIVWSAQLAPIFAAAQLDGYFNSAAPQEFFALLVFYIGSNTLGSIAWAIPFGQTEINTMLAQARDVLQWFDGMRSPVPTWYTEHSRWQ